MTNGFQRGLVASFVGILVLSFCLPAQYMPAESDSLESSNPESVGITNQMAMSSVKDNGNDIDSVMQYSRKIQGLDIQILNSFANTSSHLGSLDLSPYHISGWSLYEVLISGTNIAATHEHEVVGTSISPVVGNSFAIYEYDTENNQYYSQLSQGFYNMPHDGQLQNLSILYDSPTYDPINHHYAYVDLRSNYQDGGTNIVSPLQLSNVGLTATWAHVTQTAVLDESTTYYAVLNGTNLIEYSGVYPNIRWFYQNEAGSFSTKRYATLSGGIWGSDRPFE
ncbi:MAG: hypothetical protein ACFFDV_06420, partial [Candidatus Thorarchaeota archaeon]